MIETFRHYRAILAERDAALTAIDADLRPWCGRDPFAAQVRRLACYRGVAELAGLTFATEVCDWRRFGSAPSFMAFTGLIPSEYSSGGSQHRGHITHAGNEHLRTQLVESAWTYRYCAQIGRGLARRQAGNPRRRPWPGPGLRSGGCVPAIVAWPPANTSAPSWSPRSPASWPDSRGPK